MQKQEFEERIERTVTTMADRDEVSAQSSTIRLVMSSSPKKTPDISLNMSRGCSLQRIASNNSGETKSFLVIRLSRLLFILYHRRGDDALAEPVKC